MSNTKIFEIETINKIQSNLLKMLNECPDFYNTHIMNSPRAVGDTVQVNSSISASVMSIRLLQSAIMLLHCSMTSS